MTAFSLADDQLKKFVRYLLQGAGLNLLGLAIFWIFVTAFDSTNLLVLNICTSLTLFPASFAVNRIWVFRTNDPIGPQLKRFFVVYFSAVVLNVMIFAFFLTWLDIPPILIQALATAVLVVLSFMANYLWTFTRRHVK